MAVQGMRVADLVMCNGEAKSEASQAQTEPSKLSLTPQALINALIDIDLAYERKCKELNNGRLGATLHYHLLEKLREQHRQRREPYVRQLIALQDSLKRTGIPPDPDTGLVSR
jgi:cytosine/adenosine deaminase-related metal-dependent hydrolase